MVRVVGEDAKLYHLTPPEVSGGPEIVGTVHLPPSGVRRPRDRQSVARELRDAGYLKIVSLAPESL